MTKLEFQILKEQLDRLEKRINDLIPAKPIIDVGDASAEAEKASPVVSPKDVPNEEPY